MTYLVNLVDCSPLICQRQITEGCQTYAINDKLNAKVAMLDYYWETEACLGISFTSP